MPKPYYKTTGPVDFLQARCIFCILNSNFLFCRPGVFFVFLTVIFFYAVNKCVIINDTCHFCEEVEIFMCR